MTTKEEQVVRYLELAAEKFPYDISDLEEEMGVTERDRGAAAEDGARAEYASHAKA